MEIAVVGTGYVGLVTGTCFAESGNLVSCIDISEEKIKKLNEGQIPIYEPGLAELVKRNAKEGRLRFTTDLTEAVRTADIVYLAVGTPQGDDGAADLSALWTVVKGIAPFIRDDVIVVTKSTVPVGTNAGIYNMLYELNNKRYHVASNPEFLKEGTAINDFMYPDRVVVGVRDDAVAEILKELYSPFLRTDKPFLSMSPESAELTKYVANAMLATKISFINEMANLCERMNGDINDVRRGIGHDQRIGFQFLFPGVGYGGSCFPKDVRALASMAESLNMSPTILRAVDEINNRQKTVLINKIHEHFGQQLEGLAFAIWGIAFKPKTDDIREAPALVVIKHLLDEGAEVRIFDPEAMDNVKREHPEVAARIRFANRPIDALKGADALAINTEWDVFRHPDFEEIKAMMNKPVVFDGRNLYSCETMKKHGFTYYSIGRPTVATQVPVTSGSHNGRHSSF
ncbi:MAG TPA: UDP-glucose/GDP-mannose dehydrogenase family protein [Pirellulaceae bacterium]|nr:UDP-glucose/GDP-mannose dehydrogenase family protein [Pirellulaceae bacterium]HMO91998.1 UDP-glucose/GDP-mannose dehydrogenase family protein [Pirellulaceae bacterium]HMP68797.1 UDP-glucose/GDP-mannose dehydrogenase family protein [Pirellulaceae bacterium]